MSDFSVMYHRFVRESSRWLITKGKIDKAVNILEKIAKENGKEVNPELMESFKRTANEEYRIVSSTNLSVLDLFKTPVLRTNVILMILNWGLTSFLFEANYRSENLRKKIIFYLESTNTS